MKGNVETASVEFLLGLLGREYGREEGEHRHSVLDATILMVDDDESTVDVIEAYLQDAGFKNFIGTSDSSGVLELIDRRRPDLVLLDLMMPEVDGFDILQGMRASPDLRHVPAIVLTSSTDADVKLRALELGATDFLAKPPDSSELALRVRNILVAKIYQDRLAYTDLLTGLPNRRMFTEQLQRVLQRTGRDGRACAMLHVEIDRLKHISEALGNRIGDELLRTVADRLENLVRATDPVARLQDSDLASIPARLGGGEFGVLVANLSDPESAGTVARRLVAAVQEPFDLMGHELFVTAAVGIAIFPSDAADAETLMKDAAAAAVSAHQEGTGGCAFFSPDRQKRSLRRLTLETQLRKALERGQLHLAYQPQVDVQSGRILGAEGLLRWEHPELGSVPPDQFIPVAEGASLMGPIGDWVLHTACSQLRQWETSGLRHMGVAVNVSAQQFRQRGLVGSVRDALSLTGVDPQRITLELTESLLMENADESVEAMRGLKALGVQLSIDDFGTGYSSLSYLRRFPIEELKIDRSFLADLLSAGERSNTARIVRTVILLAHGLDLRVVAEGVEHVDQLAFLREQNCEVFQGFLVSRPVPPAAFLDLVRSHRHLATLSAPASPIPVALGV
jgi:diguanylate cyclase (GGDEF)-like protein